MEGVDCYNPSQINGLGSGTSHSSKVVVIGPASVQGAQIDYTFYQIGIGEEVVDDKGTCGNLMAAVGAYAVDEGLIDVREEAGSCTVFAYNTNIGKIIRLQVPLSRGMAKVQGAYQLSGLRKPGAKYIVDILQPGGGKLGRTLPLGPVTKLLVDDEIIEVSVVDVVNPFAYAAAESLNLSSEEVFTDLSANGKLLARLERIRQETSIRSGLTNNQEEAVQAPAIPKVAIVSPPMDYKTLSGMVIHKEEVDITAKMVSMGRFHRTFAGSGLYNLAAAVLLPGTVANACSGFHVSPGEHVVRIGHPDGIAEVRVRLSTDGQDVEYVGLDRTARRIMKGVLYITE